MIYTTFIQIVHEKITCEHVCIIESTQVWEMIKQFSKMLIGEHVERVYGYLVLYFYSCNFTRSLKLFPNKKFTSAARSHAHAHVCTHTLNVHAQKLVRTIPGGYENPPPVLTLMFIYSSPCTSLRDCQHHIYSDGSLQFALPTHLGLNFNKHLFFQSC